MDRVTVANLKAANRRKLMLPDVDCFRTTQVRLLTPANTVRGEPLEHDPRGTLSCSNYEL